MVKRVYLGWSGSILQLRLNIIKVGSKSCLLTCSSNITLSLPSYTGSALKRKLDFCNSYLSLLYFWFFPLKGSNHYIYLPFYKWRSHSGPLGPIRPIIWCSFLFWHGSGSDFKGDIFRLGFLTKLKMNFYRKTFPETIWIVECEI